MRLKGEFEKEERSKSASWRRFCGDVDSLPEAIRLTKILSSEDNVISVGSHKKEDGTTSTKESLELILVVPFPGVETSLLSWRLPVDFDWIGMR